MYSACWIRTGKIKKTIALGWGDSIVQAWDELVKQKGFWEFDDKRDTITIRWGK